MHNTELGEHLKDKLNNLQGVEKLTDMEYRIAALYLVRGLTVEKISEKLNVKRDDAIRSIERTARKLVYASNDIKLCDLKR
jgi:predicted DNA-binding protein YlxM (UPF0122 family)